MNPSIMEIRPGDLCYICYACSFCAFWAPAALIGLEGIWEINR